MSGSKHKNSKDVAFTAKKHHEVMTEPKAKRIESGAEVGRYDLFL